jgi:hypothetical protein
MGMNDFESRLITALREEAEEFSMNVDMDEAANEFDVRLDESDKSRRRWSVVVAIAATAVVVIGVGVLLGGLRARGTDQGPAGPTPSPQPRFTSSEFAPETSLTLPEWVRQSHTVWTGDQPDELWWRACWENCPGVAPSTMLVVSVASVRTGTPSTAFAPITSAQQFLDRLDAMQRLGEVALSDRSQVLVDGHPGTLLTMQEKATITGGIACETDLGLACWDLNAGDWDRLVVLNYNSRVLLLVASTASTSPQLPEIQSQFEQMLPTVRFGPTPSPGTS